MEKGMEQIKFEVFKRQHENLIVSMEMFMAGMSEMSQFAKEKERYQNAKNIVNILKKLEFEPHECVILRYCKDEETCYIAENWIAVGYCMTKYYEDIVKIQPVKLPLALWHRFKEYIEESMPYFF